MSFLLTALSFLSKVASEYYNNRMAEVASSLPPAICSGMEENDLSGE